MRSLSLSHPVERALAWLAALVGSVVAVCIVGLFSSPVPVAHFDVRTRAEELAAEVFVPPAAPPVAAPAPAEVGPAEVAPVAVAERPAVVPVADAVAPLAVPVLPGLAALRPVVSGEPGPVARPADFKPSAGGVFPEPPYPRWARQQGMQGKLQLLAEVAPSGAIADLRVSETSGHDALDRHVLDWVRARWSWAPGPRRLYLIPFVFELR